jgi:hypothetical protein
MQNEKNTYNSLPTNTVEEKSQRYGFVSKSEEEKLKEDIFRPDIEKLQLFTRMLRRNNSLNKAIITHSK